MVNFLTTHLSEIFMFISGGGIAALFSIPAKRKIINEQAKREALNNWFVQIDKLNEKVERQEKKINDLYIELRAEQERTIESLREIIKLKAQEEVSELKRCDIRGCQLRTPPSEY